MKHHIDEKWPAYDYEKGRRGAYRKYFEGGKYEPSIVDMDAYMALDDDMKKKYVVLDPSAEPFKLQHLTGLDHFFPSKDSVDFTIMPANLGGNGFFRGQRGSKRGGGRGYNHTNSSNYYQHSSYHRPEQQQQQFPQQQAPPQMPFVSEIEQDPPQYQEPQEQQPVLFQQPMQPQQEAYPYDNQQQQQMQAQTIQFPAAQGQWIPYIPPQYHMPSQPLSYARIDYQNIMPYGNFSIPPPIAATDSSPAEGDSMRIMRDAELSSTTVDWKAKESTDSTGADLPMNNIPTLRFYYNLGIRYLLASGVKSRLEAVVASELENMNINETSSGTTDEKPNEQLSSKSDQPPPAPTNTPVTTKSVYGPPGRSCGNSANNNNRRPFSSNRDNNRDYIQRDNRDSREPRNNNWNNSRKDFKFNPNVKNVHKADQKPAGNNFAGSGNGGPPKSTGSQSQVFYGSGSGQPAVASIQTSKSGVSQDKISPVSMSSATQYSPISPTPLETSQTHQIQFIPQPQEIQQPYFFNQPMPPQQCATMVLQMNDDGTMQLQSTTPTYRKFDRTIYFIF